MKKTSTVQAFKSESFKEQKLMIGLDLGDRWSFYCVLDEAGQVIVEQKLPTTPEAMKQTFGKIPRSLIALETGREKSNVGEGEATAATRRSMPLLCLRCMKLSAMKPL